jgi:hypothetical protein
LYNAAIELQATDIAIVMDARFAVSDQQQLRKATQRGKQTPGHHRFREAAEGNWAKRFTLIYFGVFLLISGKKRGGDSHQPDTETYLASPFLCMEITRSFCVGMAIAGVDRVGCLCLTN